jgi:predicted porin
MRRLVTLGLAAAAIIQNTPAAAQTPPAAAPAAPAAADAGPDLEVYGTLLPFFENVGTSGATKAGTVSTAPNLVGNGQFTGINHDRRFRMTSGTSHLGFRGGLPIAGEYLKLIWQVESPTPIDGEGPNTWASRNSHVGFTGVWGTLSYGNWDTPMKTVTATSVNPIKGGYVADMIPIIGAPGAQTPALNPDPILLAAWQLIPNRAGFFRHEVNAVQYWTPTVFGFSARVMFGANEHRLAGIPGSEAAVNPYLVSGYVGWDNSWLRLRYSAELHNDYFGAANLGGQGVGFDTNHSRDIGHLALASVTINADSPYRTRIVAVGDHLTYHTDDNTQAGVGIVTDISRSAFYGLIQQSFGPASVWVAGGHATEGTCGVRPSPVGGCKTKGLSADYGTLGFLYSFTKDSGVFAIGYGLFNDVAARYSPFPILDRVEASAPFLPNVGEISHGADTTGFGIGFVHSFNVGIFGQAKTPAAVPTKEAPAVKEEIPAPDAKPEPQKEQPDAEPNPDIEKTEEAPKP